MMAVDETHKPPKCPFCGKPLKTVWYTTYETYTFDPKTNSYKGEPYGDSTAKCPHCDTDLQREEDLGFENGPINYPS